MSQSERVAIVGMGAIFPQSPTLAHFWSNVVRCVDTAQAVPPGRWLLDPSDIYDPRVAIADKVYSQRGCFIENFALDAEGLAIDRELLAQLDPMFHLVLHAGKEAWRDAETSTIDRSRVGVILGNIVLPTEKASALARDYLGPAFEQALVRSSAFRRREDPLKPELRPATHPLNRYVAGLPSGILSKALGLGGGGFTLDAACASSLYALKLAADELLAGRADAMLAGGLSRPDCLYTQMGFSQLRALSPSGRASPFDARADGLVVGEGSGILVLKRLVDAERDGDHIYAVIAGIGLSNDIEGNLLAPSSEGQLRAMRTAYQQAGWQPDDVDLIECHATGTQVGDAVEFSSLRRLWENSAARTEKCVIGSVKSNIGHALTAAGAAGLLKVLLALKHETLPPSANFSAPNPQLQYADSPFQVLSEPKAWRRREQAQPRRAAVSGFGFGGINAHLLLEEWLTQPARSHINASGGTGVSAGAGQSEMPMPSANVPVAIVGLAAHLGPWKSLQSFQERVFGGDTTEPKPPENWWGIEGTDFPGFYLSEVAFPRDRFRIPPKELEEMLPQQLLMLHVAAQAVADAGLPDDLGTQTGVFIGIGLDLNTTNFSFRWSLLNQARIWNQEYQLGLSEQELREWTAALREAAGPPLSANRTMGALGGIVASRIARAFRVGGPSFTVSSEETSGLSALGAAVRMLQCGELKQAIVGAVDLAGDPRAVLAANACRPPAEGEPPIPPTDGAAALIVKRLCDAELDGDRIYAVIRGVGMASGGGVELTGPKTTAGERAIRRAFAECGWSLDSMHHHKMQAGAIVGNAGAAGGLASLVEAVASLAQEMLPGKEPMYWLRNRAEGPRRNDVGWSSVDNGCVHVVLESAEPQVKSAAAAQPVGARSEALFAVEGDDVAALRQGMLRLRHLAESFPGGKLEKLARAWWREQPLNPAKKLAAAFVARSRNDLLDQLAQAACALVEASQRRLAADDRVFLAPEPLGRSSRMAFVYPGSGNHFAGMGRAIAAEWPEVLRKQDAENQYLREQLLPAVFWNGDVIPPDTNNRTLILSQVALGAVVSDLLMQFGLRPQAALGYSLGESAALFGLRAWTERDEMLRRLKESMLFTTDLAGPCHAARRAWRLPEHEAVSWSAGVVDCSAEAVRHAMRGIERVYLLIINTARESVIGGARTAVERLTHRLRCNFLPLTGVSTVHCPIAREVAQSYRELHLLKTTPPQGVDFYSGAWGRAYPLTRESAADAIVAQALDTLDFPALFTQTYADGIRIFVEIGPGASCSRIIGQILGDRPHLARSVCIAGQDAVSVVLRTLAQLIAERVPVDLSALYGGYDVCEVEANRTNSVMVRVGGAPFNPPPWPSGAQREEEHISSRPEAVTDYARAMSTEPVSAASALIAQWSATEAAKAEAHEAYLRFADNLQQTMASHVAFQMTLPQAVASGQWSVVSKDQAGAEVTTDHRPLTTVFLDRDQCLEFAVGSIARVLGPGFAEVDTYPTRVRLPDEPLMLVDRIMSVEGEPRSLGSGRVVTEHDVRASAWYLDGGRIPTCIAVEAGQADLFLSGYLGIDFETKGQAVYRLLDAVVTFHRSLPKPGDIIHYDIRIERFFRQDATYLFRFSFEGTVNGEPLLTMRDGCAGFFTAAELAAGKGVVHTELDRQPRPGVRPTDWKPLVPMAVESYDEAQISALRSGNLSACFGPAFAGLPLQNPLRLPAEKMRLIDRVTLLDPYGGRFGLGVVRADADIHPGDWFLTCHFVDDQVMPGTLMYECCLHTLRVFLMRMGWVGEQDEVVCEPVPEVASRLKCRGQVIASTKKATYEVVIKEIGYRPEPFVLADALMYADGKPIVEITNMSLRMSGLSREKVEAIWRWKATPAQSQVETRTALFDHDRILAFAIGKPSEAFGEPYKVFDHDRIIARLPGPPYQFLDRIMVIEAEPWQMKAGGVIEAEYDVPPDAWYFAANRQAEMPFAVLLEIALQPCGWLAAYLGSALTSPIDLSFRNLGGHATLFSPVTPGIGTLTTRVKITKVASSGGMIIQNYDFAVRSGGQAVYHGDTYFGFFSKAALAQQVGIRDATVYQPSDRDQTGGRAFIYPPDSPFPDKQLRMVEAIDLFTADGGPHGLGVIQGRKTVDPAEWFFKAHFYQDPVCPGSLGLESFLQLLKVVAAERWRMGPNARFGTISLAKPHRWVYRGQVIPRDRQVTVQAAITAVDDQRKTLLADGYLLVDGRVIYQMNDFGLTLATETP